MKTTYKNEQIKRRFCEYLRNSKGLSEGSIRCSEKAIWLWEDFTKNSDFGSFNKKIAGEFKNWLKNKKKKNSAENISLSYCHDTLRHIKTFFGWLSKQLGYKSKINQTDVDYLNLTKKETNEATQSKSVKCPTLDEIKKTIESINDKTEIGMRDKALFSLFLLTGARVSAVRTLTMKSFDKNRLILYQDSDSNVETKFSKKIVSALISFSYKEPLDYFLKWFNYLEKQKKFKPNDPIFPRTKEKKEEGNISYCCTEEVESEKLENSCSLREVFKKRFEQAGLDYYHPHTFRHWLVKEISKLPLTEEEKKAISQNLGHENVGTTFDSYGYSRIEENRQIEIVQDIDFENRKQGSKPSFNQEMVDRIIEGVSKKIKSNT